MPASDRHSKLLPDHAMPERRLERLVGRATEILVDP
jgi:hypothetical protein